MSERGSRKNTENENKIEVVQIDGLVLMKLIKHCHEVRAFDILLVCSAVFDPVDVQFCLKILTSKV